MLHKAGKGLHLQFEQLLLLLGEFFPVLNFVGLASEHGAIWHNPHRFLPGQRFLTQRVPTVSKAAFVFITPLYGRMMRRVCCARRVINEERLIRRHRLLESHPRHRLICHIGGEVVVRVVLALDLGHPVINDGIPLVGLTANKAVELVEARVSRPAEERA